VGGICSKVLGIGFPGSDQNISCNFDDERIATICEGRVAIIVAYKVFFFE
jgi:hypothetical protein